MENYELVIIGAGPAGLFAAMSAAQNGVKRIMVLERRDEPGGIPAQCLHRGFGKQRFGSELSGAEYAARILSELDASIDLRVNSFATELSPSHVVTVWSTDSVYKVTAGAVILATGCRERPVGSLKIHGARPAGIFTAGSVQRMLNLKGYIVGKRIIVLGSGDVGMIVSHHLAESGATVIAVLEKDGKLGGLKRNKRRYLDPHGISVIMRSTVTRLYGQRRLEAVDVHHVNSSGEPIAGLGYRLECDTLVSSVGLIPETELVDGFTDPPWLFVCGNARTVHSLVDSVEQDGVWAGISAAGYLGKC